MRCGLRFDARSSKPNMRSFSFFVGRVLTALFLFSAISSAVAGEAPPVKRVLIISMGSRLAPGFVVVDQQLLAALAKIQSVRIETYAENLDLVRFSSEYYGKIFRDYLTAKYTDNPPDLVILVYVGNLAITGRFCRNSFQTRQSSSPASRKSNFI